MTDYNRDDFKRYVLREKLTTQEEIDGNPEILAELMADAYVWGLYKAWARKRADAIADAHKVTAHG